MQQVNEREEPALTLPPHLQEARDALETRLGELGMGPESQERPRLAIVLGSGLAGLAESAEILASVAYDAIPGMSASRVEGHESRWIVGRLGGVTLHMLAGRRHLYEGVGEAEAAFATRLIALLGVRLLVLTNASGGLSPRLWPGDIMLIRDCINLQMRNPLRGPNLDELGPRFPDMSEPYYPPAQAMIRQSAMAEKIALKEGTYAALMGPAFETPAEAAMLRRMGADAVGMSTVPETLAARHAGIKVAALSLVTNSHVKRAGEAKGPTTHDEVLEAGRHAQGRLEKLMRAALPRLALLTQAPALADHAFTSNPSDGAV